MPSQANPYQRKKSVNLDAEIALFGALSKAHHLAICECNTHNWAAKG